MCRMVGKTLCEVWRQKASMGELLHWKGPIELERIEFISLMPCYWDYDSIILLIITLRAHLRTNILGWLLKCTGIKKEDKTLLQHSQLSQHGEFRHVSVSERQRSRPCGQNLRVPFLRMVLSPEVGESAQANYGGHGETKALVSPPPRWVSAQLLCGCVTAS